jgi:cell wall-associated NlpC family hydrolase
LRIAHKLLRTLILGIAAVAIVAPAGAAVASPADKSIQQQIDEQNNALEKVIEQYNKVTILLQQDQAQQVQLQTQLDAQQDQVNKASADVGQMAAAAYKGGPMTNLAALVSADSPQAFMSQLSTLNEAAHQRVKELSTYKQAKAKLQTDKDKLDQNTATQATQQKQLAGQKTQIDAKIADLKKLQAKAPATKTDPASVSKPKNAPYVAGAAGKAVNFAYDQLGAEYHYAKAGPYSVGYDCSGLTMASWQRGGVYLPHNAAMQWDKVTHISKGNLKAGDLIFYNDLGHVAIYIGGGKVIHAPHTGDVVKIASMSIDSIYGYGRPKA